MADKLHYRKKTERGQSMAEYALIVALVIIGFGLALAATGPAIANVFSNAVFNLVSRDRLAAGVTPPSAANFWATMTWVATQTPQEIPLATRTLPPPTLEPTDGPSPTPTPITPTNTPTNTPTITPSPTPQDKNHVAPWTDSANERVNWRLDQFDVGTENWFGDYFPNNRLNGSPTDSFLNTGTAIGKIDFDWGSSLPPVTGWTQTDNYSIRWRKGFFVEKDKKATIQFDIPSINEGIRIWILGPSTGVDSSGGTGQTLPGTCSNQLNPTTSGPTNTQKVVSGGTPWTLGQVVNTNGRWRIYDDAFFGYDPASSPDSAIPPDCLVVDRWTQGDSSSRINIRRTVSGGTTTGNFYVIQIDYAETSGSADVTVDVTNSGVSTNPDNTEVTSGGAPIAGTNSTANCDWGNVQNLGFSDSPEFYWDEHVSSAGMPRGSRCYLELRGSVQIPVPTPDPARPTWPVNAQMVNPVLTFWDLWDFQPGTRAWVEIADYDSDGDGVFSRALDLDGKWVQIPLHINNTFNYNWTYQTIPLYNPAPGGWDFRGKKVALRFGMENASSNAVNRWWVDTITIDSITRQVFSPAKTWDLNTPTQTKDFVTSGHWALTTENALGSSGMAWHDSPNRDYTKLFTSRNAGTGDQRDFRIHSIEWNGIIDINLSPVDEDGDNGDPILTFYHQYNVRRLVGLEIQYTTDPYSAGDGADWQTVPGGQIIARTNTTDRSITLPEKITIPLKAIGPTQFRLRFAMLVNRDANLNSGGWWIDEIRLERIDRPRFTNYPFHDPVEDPATINQWQILGTWDRANNGYAPATGSTGFSYTDTVAGNYTSNDNSVFELKYPLDFRLDTPQNARATNCNLGASLCETGPFPVPTKPFLTFMWKHEFGSGENFYVEWKRFNDPQTAWSAIWAYTDRMATQSSGSRTATRSVRDWERAEVNLKPIMDAIATNDPGSQQEDDIMIRFRFQTNSSGEADGVYLDDIRLEEGVEDVWYLWPSTESRTDSTGSIIRDAASAPILGSGNIYRDSLEDNPKLFTGGWFYGGGWQAITFAQRDGLYSFHDSADGQLETEPYNQSPIIVPKQDSFNVLEMNKIIDLRGVAATERPVMYFWSRWNVRSSNYLRVQISAELTTPASLCNGGYAQCYEHNLGWSEWETVWEQTNARNFTWTREQIALDAYAKNSTIPGRRIRIRFVHDTLDTNSDRDGWYIDGITIRYLTERRIIIDASQSFADGARDMNNWIGEGLWGLDPEFYKGSGGGPISLLPSTWSASYWHLITGSTNRCTTPLIHTDFLTCANKFLSETGTNRWNTVTPSYTQPALLDINYSWGTGGPKSNQLRDYFVGRWTLTTQTMTTNPVYTFIVASDDGVRLKMTTNTGVLPPCVGGDDSPLCGNTWNIINNWTYHGRTVDMGIAKLFAAGAPGQSYSTGRYTFTLEYFEGTGDAGLSLSIGANTFSFSDSPKQGSGLLFPEIEAVPRGNSSLILNGAFDLRNATTPVLRFWTRYEMGGNARVEVTTDGGFTWTQDGLDGKLAESYFIQPEWAGQYWSGGSSKQLDRAGAAPNRTQNAAEINFNYGGNPLLPGYASDNVAVRWRRQLNITTPLPLTFRTTGDDGIRLWITSPGDPNSPNTGAGCATGYTSPQLPFMRSGDNARNDTTFATGCLLIDNWQNQGGGVRTVSRTLGVGTHWLQLDFYEATGGARARLEIFPQGYSSPTWGGTYQPSDLSNWQERLYDLSSYIGLPAVGLRFRLDRLGTTSTNSSNQSPINWRDGLWIVDVNVANS